MDIKQAKENLLTALDSIDKDKLSLTELKVYADILKVISEIHTKSYQEYLSDMMTGFSASAYKPATVSELKGGV